MFSICPSLRITWCGRTAQPQPARSLPENHSRCRQVLPRSAWSLPHTQASSPTVASLFTTSGRSAVTCCARPCMRRRSGGLSRVSDMTAVFPMPGAPALGFSSPVGSSGDQGDGPDAGRRALPALLRQRGRRRSHGFLHHGSPNTGTPPEPLYPAAAERASAGFPTTGPVHELDGHPGTRPRRPPTRRRGRRARRRGVRGPGPLRRRLARAGVRRAAAGPRKAVAEGSRAGALRRGRARLVRRHDGYRAAEIRAAAEGREALEGYLASHEFDMEQFTPADQAALLGDWAWLARIAGWP